MLIAGNGEGCDGWNQLAVAFCDGDGDRIERVIVDHLAARYRRRYLADGVGIRPGAGEGQVLEGCDILVFDLRFGERNFRLVGQRGRCRIGAGCFQLEGHGAVIDGLSFAGGIGFGSPEAGERAGIFVILVIAVDDGNGILLSGFFDLAGGHFSGLTVDCGAPVLVRELCGFLHAPGGAEGQVEEGEGFAGVDVIGRRFAACKLQLAGLCGGVSDLAGIGDFAVVSVVIQRDFQRVAGREARRLVGEVGYGLADLQAADALVGDDDGRLAGEQAREVAVAQIGLQVFVLVTVGNGRLLDVEPEPAGFCAPGETFVFCVNRDIAERLDGMVFLEAFGVQLQIDSLFGYGLFQRGIPARLRFHAGGGDIGEGAVNVVNGGKGGHGRDQMALRDRDGHAVVGGAGVGDDAMRIIHDHGDRRGVDLVAHRRAVLNEVVLALGEHALSCGRELRLAVFVGRDGVISAFALVDGPTGVGNSQIILLVEGEGHAVDRIVVVVELLHVEVVLDVGDIDGGGELAVEVFAVDQMGVLHSGPRKVAFRGVIERDGVGCVRIVAPVIIVPEIAGTVFKFGHVRTVCRGREDDGVAVGLSVVMQGFDHGGDIAAGFAACHLPAGQSAACDDAPGICGGRRAHADILQTAHDDGEELAAGIVEVYRFVCAGQDDVGAGGDAAFESGVGAGGPAVVFVVEKDGVQLMFVKLEIDAVVVAIAGAVFVPLLENEIMNAALFQVVETDRDIVRIGEDEAAVFIRGAGADGFVAGLGILVCAVAIACAFGGVEVKLDAGEEGAVLIDLDAVGLGDVGQVEFHCEVRIRAAALEIEELERMVGVIGEGVATPEVGIFLVGIIWGHLFLQRSGIVAVDGDVAVGEVDGRCGLIVDAAEVGHEDAVDEDPDVVVTRKLEGHGLVAVLGGLAVIALHKAGGHGDAEEVVYVWILRVDSRIRHQLAVVVLCKNVEGGWAIEGEELPFLVTVARFLDAPGIVDRKGVRFLVKAGVVGGFIRFAFACLIIIGVEIVVAVIVDLEQAVHVPERLFAERAALTSVLIDLFRFVEEIVKGLRTGKAVVFFQAGVVS